MKHLTLSSLQLPRSWKRLLIVVVVVTLAVEFVVLLAFWFYQAPVSRLRSETYASALLRGKIVYRYSDQSPGGGSLDIVLIELSDCITQECLPALPLLRDCTSALSCSDAWEPAKDVPANARSHPNYPPDVAERVDALWPAADTRCIFARRPPAHRSAITAVCVNVGQRLLLFRSGLP